MKIAINRCYGGFSISKACAEHMGIRWIGSPLSGCPDEDYERTDPRLIKAIEEMGPAANGYCADLHIVEIPDDVEWTIESYDGMEWIAETHRTWR